MFRWRIIAVGASAMGIVLLFKVPTSMRGQIWDISIVVLAIVLVFALLTARMYGRY